MTSCSCGVFTVIMLLDEMQNLLWHQRNIVGGMTGWAEKPGRARQVATHIYSSFWGWGHLLSTSSSPILALVGRYHHTYTVRGPVEACVKIASGKDWKHFFQNLNNNMEWHRSLWKFCLPWSKRIQFWVGDFPHTTEDSFSLYVRLRPQERETAPDKGPESHRMVWKPGTNVSLICLALLSPLHGEVSLSSSPHFSVYSVNVSHELFIFIC